MKCCVIEAFSHYSDNGCAECKIYLCLQKYKINRHFGHSNVNLETKSNFKRWISDDCSTLDSISKVWQTIKWKFMLPKPVLLIKSIISFQKAFLTECYQVAILVFNKCKFTPFPSKYLSFVYFDFMNGDLFFMNSSILG